MSAELAWFKSSYSNEEGGACVEVAACPCAVHVRDSKFPDGPAFATSPEAWTGFLAHVNARGDSAR